MRSSSRASAATTIRALEAAFRRDPENIYKWSLVGTIVQKTMIHRWQKNGRNGTHFILLVHDDEGLEIKLTMFQYTQEAWDFIREGATYRISNPRTYGRSDAKTGKLQYRNALFNRLPRLCEIVFDHQERHPFSIKEIFTEMQGAGGPAPLNYDFLPSLRELEEKGFNSVHDICAIVRGIERSVVVTLLLCDPSGTEVALILYPADQRHVIGLDSISVGTTVSIKDVTYKEDAGRYRRVLKLRHSYGSYIIFGKREELPGGRWLPMESAEGVGRKDELEEWWRDGGWRCVPRCLSRPFEICAIRDFLRKPVVHDRIYETVLGTLELLSPRGEKWRWALVDENDGMDVFVDDDRLTLFLGLSVWEIRAMEEKGKLPLQTYRPFKVECSRRARDNLAVVETVDELTFGEAACYYASLINRM
jgi:hypothetical protein